MLDWNSLSDIIIKLGVKSPQLWLFLSLKKILF